MKIKGIHYILLAAAAGIVLLLLPTSGGEQAAAEGMYGSASEYCASLEKKACDLIEQLGGVKSCSVVITLSTGYEYVYASDQRLAENYNESGAVTGKESEKNIVVVETVSGSAPVLVREKMPQVTGVAVVCKGATQETRFKIVELLGALFDVAPERISIQA